MNSQFYVHLNQKETFDQSEAAHVITWLCTFHLAWGASKHRSVAELQGAGVRIWIWPWIMRGGGGGAVITAQAGGLRVGLKNPILLWDKDKSAPDSSAAARANRPHNTSLTSILSGQGKTAAVMCRENVFTGYMTYGWHGILIWSAGYTILYKGRP